MPKLTEYSLSDPGRHCNLCKEYKLWDNFGLYKSGACGHNSVCKDCSNERTKTKYGYSSSPEYRIKQVCRIYNLNSEQESDYRSHVLGDKPCAACKKPFNGGVPFVDHDHKCCPGRNSCGRCVRGFIHSHCNFILGRAKDDPCLLDSLSEYAHHFSYRWMAIELYFKLHGKRCIFCSRSVELRDADLVEQESQYYLMHATCVEPALKAYEESKLSLAR